MRYIKTDGTILCVLILTSFWINSFSQNLIVQGDTLFAHKKYKEALVTLNKAVAKYPDSCRAYFYRGSTELMLYNSDSAISDFNKAINLHLKSKDLADAYYDMGMLKAIKRDNVGAIYSYNKAIEISPNNWLSYYGKANIEYPMGEYSQALEDINMAAKLSNDSNPGIYNTRGGIEFSLKDTLDALKDYNFAVKKDINNTTPYYGRTEVKTAMKDYPGALNDVNKILSIEPTSLAFVYRGNIKEKIKDTAGAFEDYNKAIASDVNFPRAYFDKGCLEENLKKYSDAVSDFTKAISIYPEYILYYIHRGYCYEVIGKKADGCNDFQKAFDMGDVEGSDLMKKYCK